MKKGIDKEKLAKRLGAKEFQKLVYKVEDIKYSLLKNQLSFLVPIVEKIMKSRKNRLINKTSDHVKQELIENNYKNELILFRKELKQEKNRNYHLARFERVETKLEERKKNALLQKTQKYGNAINAINKQIEKSDSLPKLDVKQMKIQELKELRNLLTEVNSTNKILQRVNKNHSVR